MKAKNQLNLMIFILFVLLIDLNFGFICLEFTNNVSETIHPLLSHFAKIFNISTSYSSW